jgi:hypothetical protein
MSKEKPNGDPRQQSDWPSTKQTDQPWKAGPKRNNDRMVQRPKGARKEK